VIAEKTILFLNPEELPPELPRLARDFLGVRTIDEPYRKMPCSAYQKGNLETARLLLEKHPDSAGVVYGTGYQHHRDLGFGCAFAARSRSKPQILFADRHFDDYVDYEVPEGAFETIDCGSFSHHLFKKVGAKRITFVGAESESQFQRHVEEYQGNETTYNRFYVMRNGLPVLPRDAPIISLNDLDVLSPFDIFTSWPALPSWPIGARDMAHRLAETLDGRTPLGFTVLGYDREPRYEYSRMNWRYRGQEELAKERSAYSYAATMAPLVGRSEKIDRIMDEADERFPVPGRAGPKLPMLKRFLEKMRDELEINFSIGNDFR
jgi:hypothetical protein